ncbi:MAG: CPBP family intramembrane metalloprotease [Lachnospiraceae bacterium]|nr:CPBP family intramembrane metalloprotease [Lachnospiraceae bacterium]
MKKLFSKLGYFIVSMLPGIVYILLQLTISVGVVFFLAFYISFSQADSGIDLSQGQLMQQVLDVYNGNLTLIILLVQLAGLIIFGLWYYLAYGRKNPPADREKPGIKAFVVVIVAGIFLQCFVSSILSLIDACFPNALNSYKELMEQSGLMEETLLSFLCASFLAPIGEEMLCRGITFRLAGKVSMRFWVANCIQAFAFGLIHLNLVQGCYAFFLGLVLGYIYGKYRNIFVCMLMHASVNASSHLMELLWAQFPEGSEMAVYAVGIVLSAVLLLAGYLILGKIKPLEEDGISFPATRQKWKEKAV